MNNRVDEQHSPLEASMSTDVVRLGGIPAIGLSIGGA